MPAILAMAGLVLASGFFSSSAHQKYGATHKEFNCGGALLWNGDVHKEVQSLRRRKI